jgi:dihydrofolate synthase/folylpolyglutamate synthase
MNYSQTLEYLFNSLPMYQRQGKAAYKANLDNTHKLDKHFNYPHQRFKSIHIAGTNGKRLNISYAGSNPAGSRI